MNSIKICFISNWGESSKQLLERYSEYTPNNSGRWNNLIGITNVREADIFVVMQGLPKKGEIDRSRTIFFQREPEYICKLTTQTFWKKMTYNNYYHAQTWWIRKPFNFLEELSYPVKNKKMSFIVSNKQKTDGQKFRVALAKKLSNVDIFGKRLQEIIKADAYKGTLNSHKNCKFKGLYPYKYSICCENGQRNNYFTEKITDAFLSWAVPIYWGCPNISEYFPEGSYIALKDLNNLSEVNLKALKEARNLVLYKYNIWNAIYEGIK